MLLQLDTETNIFDNLITNNEILRKQNLSLAPSRTSAEAIFKQLWSSNY